MIGLDPVPQFPLGDVVLTPSAARKLKTTDVKLAIARHSSGDWGELEPEDRRVNDESVQNGGLLASIYKTAAGVKFYIVTESSREVTTVLLPEEF